MKLPSILLSITLFATSALAMGEKQFDQQVISNVSNALKISKDQKKPLIIIAYDPKSPTKSKFDYAVGYFMESKLTKKAVKDNFIVCVAKKTDPDLSKYFSASEPLENATFVVLDKEGELLVQEAVYANPEAGKEHVQAWLDKLAAVTPLPAQ